MHKKLIIILLITFCKAAFADADFVLESDTSIYSNKVKVLIDENFTLNEILNNPKLSFEETSKISVKGIDYYWIKYTVQNNTPYDKNYAIWVTPSFNFELNYFNEVTQQWESTVGGELIANNRDRFKYTPCVFPSRKSTTIYLKVDVRDINTEKKFLITDISMKKLASVVSKRTKTFNWWLATVVIVLAFLIYNTFWFFLIRERVYFYYLLILAGGILYITCFNFFLSLFMPLKRLNAYILLDGSVSYQPIEFMFLQLATLIVILGLVQFTRIYLQTKIHFPIWDKILKYVFVVFCVQLISISVLEYLLVIKSNNIYALIQNLITILILLLMVFLGIKSYRNKIKQAKYYLLALLIPLLILVALVGYLIVYQDHGALYYLPNLAVLSITITFAIALVSRVNLIKDELNAEKLETQAQATSIQIQQERNLRLEEKIAHDKIEIEAAKKTKLLMKELHHRVKNNLQIVSSLLSLQSLRIKDTAVVDAIKEGQHRVEAMSLIHQRLYIQDNITQVNIKEFIPDIAESLMLSYGYSYDDFKLELEISEDLMDVDKAIPLSIILNELITNAFKYAYDNIENPSLKISLTKPSQNIELVVADNGKGIALDNWQKKSGYGKELVETFTKQLDGSISLSVNGGTTFKIEFPFY